VIFITRDRSLIDLVADRLRLAADGLISPFEGDRTTTSASSLTAQMR